MLFQQNISAFSCLTANQIGLNKLILSVYSCKCRRSKLRSCTECLDGFYLLTNSTNPPDILSAGVDLTFCVPDCPLADPRYTNNPLTQTCEDCGSGCTACSILNGCESCPGEIDQTSYSYLDDHPLYDETSFKMCEKCHLKTDGEECYKCSITDQSSKDPTCSKCTYGISDSNCNSDVCSNDSGCDINCSITGCICFNGLGQNSNSCTFCDMTACQKCSGTDCLKCNNGYTLKQDPQTKVKTCSECTNLSTLFYNDCSACSISGPPISQIIQCTQCSSSLTLNGNSCETSCNRGSYISTTTTEDMGVYDVNTCIQCNAPCYECASNTECISCAKNYFLNYKTSGGVIGTCKAITKPKTTYNLFVKASYEETDGDGSYDYPFGNIVKAISYAQEQTANQVEATVNIYLLKGDHFMTRNYDHYSYDKTKESKYSYNSNIVIQPAICGQTIDDHTFGDTDADCSQTLDQVTVYYQMGNSYSFIVPKSLKLKSIIFDALDSSLLPSEECLQYNSRCCTISNGQMFKNSDNLKAPTTCSVQTIQTEECKTTFGTSFFQFGYSDTLSNINGVGTLTIDGCTFKNFFYDFTSLIGLINGHGKVIITGSTFDSFSNCGSIIRDTQELPSLDYTKSQGIETTSYRQSMNSINIFKNKYYVKPTTCTSTSCASIQIDTSTFTNFNLMKSGGKTYHQVISTSKMMFQGIILNLSNFYGNIVVKSNTFTGLKFKYNNCEEVYNPGTNYESDNIWGSPTILQSKTLIYVKVNSGQLEIYSNTFENCNSLMGLIYLHRSSSFNSPILIHQNTFTQNSAILGANVINIYLWTNTDYKTLFKSQSMICAGVQISSNIFTQNVGCFNTIGTIQAVCYLDSSDVPLSQKTQYSDPQSMSKNKSDNLSKSGIVSFTTVNNTIMSSSSVQIDLNKFLLKQNTYNENFAGAQASIVKLVNIRRIHIDSDTYINNCGQYLESLNKYGSIMSTGDTSDRTSLPGAYSLFAYYGSSGTHSTINEVILPELQQNYYPVGFLVIDGSLYVYTTGLIFDNNAMQELTQSLVTSQYPSNAITLRRSQGNIYLNSLTIQNYAGLDMNKLSSILGTDYANIKIASPTERNVQGSPNTLASSPNYYIDYSFKNCLIRLAVPSSTTTNTDFQNYFDVFSIDKLTIKNITQYDPSASTALFSQFSDDCTDLTLSNFDIKSVNMIQAKTSMFVIQNYGTLTIINGAISNINQNAYSLKTSDYSYVGSNGVMFTLNSVQQNANYLSFTSSISNVTFDTIYSREGGAFYFGSNLNTQNAQSNTITMNLITIKNSFAYSNGLMFFASGSQFVTISNSNFQSNKGVEGEADIMFQKAGSLSISASFSLFSSSSVDSGQSITFDFDDSVNFNVKLSSVTIKCSNEVFDSTKYVGYLSSYPTNSIIRSPITILSGKIESSNCVFSNCFATNTNGGIIYIEGSSTFSDTNSVFKENASMLGGAVHITQSTATFSGTTFLNNYSLNGGAIAAVSSSSITIQNNVNCSSNYVSKEGGCLYAIGESKTSIDLSTFSHNYAGSKSSAIYFLGTGANTFSNSVFSNNNADKGNTISLLFASTQISNLTFTNNYAGSESAGIFITFSDVTIENSSFSTTEFPNNELTLKSAASSASLFGCYISISSGASVTISNSNFENGYAVNGGAIYVSGNSKLTIRMSNFITCAAKSYGGAIYASGFESLNISNCKFTSNIGSLAGCDLYLNSGTSIINNSEFLLDSSQTSIYIIGGDFTGQSINMTNTLSTNSKISNLLGGGIYGSNINTFSVLNSNFNKINYAENGGAIYLLGASLSSQTIPTSPSCIIRTCVFNGNSAINGGVIYISSVDYVSIQDSSFTNNSATNGKLGYGGAIYYYSSDQYSQIVFESGNVFTDNSALISGGAVYWNYNAPKNASTQSYSNNIAKKYGNNYACFAQSLQTITQSQYNIQKSSRRSLTTSSSTSLSVTNQQSGGALSIIYIALVDQYGQIVGSDSSSTATLSISGSYSGTSYTPTLTGTTTQTAINGAFIFSGITFTAQPGSTYSLSFTTTGIDSTKPSNEAYLSSNSLVNTAMSVTVALRLCTIGESFSTSGACVQCASPDYYSLTDQTSPGNCKSCQSQKMYCKGGSDVGPKSGYWRSSLSSDNFISCLYSGACLGYVSPSNNKLGECFTGYQGVLCADCKSGFSRTNDYTCGACPNAAWNIIRLLLLFAAVIIVIVIIIRSTLAGALQRKNIQSVYIKILMNHLQLLTLTASFNLKWPSNVDDLLSSSKPAAEVSTQILSFDCFLDQRQNGGSNIIRLYYQKMIMYAALPLIMAVVSTIFWTIFYCCAKRTEANNKNGRIVASLIILFFLVHPSIVQYMFSNFNCLQIDNDKRVTDDLQVVCWEAEHVLYSMSIAVPSLVIWGFGIPLFAWIVLARNRDDLDLIETREKYGFLYNGYKKNYYFWESVNMYRKITIIFISVFLKLAGVITQALVIFLVLITFLVLNMKLMPFSFQSLNDMEMLSILTCMLTIYCGLFFLSDMPEVYNSTDSSVKEADNGLRLNTGSKLFFFFVILFSNIVFILYWTYKMYEEIKNTMRTNLKQVYLYVCLCGNKKRLENEISKRAIQDENDILKEEFDLQLDAIKSLWKSNPRKNMEKSAAYLNPKKFLDNIIEKQEEPNEEDLRRIKREKRRYEGERMRQNLFFQNDSGESHMSPKTLYPYNNYVKTEEKEESNSYMKGLSEFICLPNQEVTKIQSKPKKLDNPAVASSINFESISIIGEAKSQIQSLVTLTDHEITRSAYKAPVRKDDMREALKEEAEMRRNRVKQSNTLLKPLPQIKLNNYQGKSRIQRIKRLEEAKTQIARREAMTHMVIDFDQMLNPVNECRGNEKNEIKEEEKEMKVEDLYEIDDEKFDFDILD